MSILKTHTAACILLFAASAIVRADDVKKPPVKAPAAAPAPARAAAPAPRPAPQQAPARTAAPNINRPAPPAGGRVPNNAGGGRPATGVGANPAGAPAANPGRGVGTNPNIPAGRTGGGWNNNPGAGGRAGNANPNNPNPATTANPANPAGRTGAGWNNNPGAGGRAGNANPNNPNPATTANPANPAGRTGAGWNNNPNNNPGGRVGNVNTNPNANPAGRGVNPNGGFPGNRAGSAPGNMRSPGVTRGPNGRVESYRGANGSEARFRRDGSVHEVRRGDTVITHGPGGTRRIMSERADHSRIVTNRAGHGYVQRPFSYRGHEYAHRTYYYRGAAYPRYYRTYSYRGVYLETYAPARYYSPAFYGWAYYPWATPVSYRWGYVSAPWYGYYGGYFSPYQSYPSASYWLTDYIVADTLTSAYQEQVDAGVNMQGSALVAGGGGSPLTPDVKAEIAAEVQRQLTLENAERKSISENTEPDPSSSGIPRLLSDNTPHTFVVASSMVVMDTTGQECSITQGDVVLMSGTSLADGNMVPVQVRASKNKECAKGSMVAMSLEDLQDMENHMRATIDQGLVDLQSHPGQGGLPTPPREALAAPVQAAFASAAPPVDANVSTELIQEAHNADQVEQQVVTESQSAQTADNLGSGNLSPEPAPAQTATISLGQTIDQVVAILGKPLQIADLGSKKIYKFKDMKITFVNGKVNDVQ